LSETKDVSKAKLVTPVAKPTPGVPPPTESGPKKVVAKKVVKKVVRPATGPTSPPKPAVATAKGTTEEDGFEVEPIEEKEPELARTVTGPTTTDDGRKGGLRELLTPKKTTPEARPVVDGMDDDGIKDLGSPGRNATEDIDAGGKDNKLLDDIDLDKITKNIQEDLLETFEEKIDDILVDIIDDEDAVEELTKMDDQGGSKGTEASQDRGSSGLDELLEDKGKATTAPPKPVTTVPPRPTKTEVGVRPVVKLEPDVEAPKKDVVAEEPVTMEKVELKMIGDGGAQPKKDEPKAAITAPASAETIRIDEGDVRERRVAYKVARNFDKLPPNMRNELLRNLAKVGDPKVREDVVCAIATHFKGLPQDIQALMTNLSRDDDTRVREEVVFEIQKNFADISMTIRERILKALLMDKEPSIREEVVAAICEHYADLSSDVRELLRTLAKDKVRSVREELSFQMQKTDSPVPKEVRDEVLGMLKGQR